MPRPIRIAILAPLVALVLGTGAAVANDSRSQLIAAVEHELPYFVPGVDPESLTTQQLAAIRGIMFGSDSQSRKRAGIRSVVGGKFSFRGLFFN